MSAQDTRLEVMKNLDGLVPAYSEKYLITPEEIWQPADFLPDPLSGSFIKDIETLRGEAKELEHDFWVVLIGDMVTEEALPTYETWLMDVDGIEQHGSNNWAKWVRQWTAEENRHGDLLNKYLYLSGRVNMRQVEQTVQYLIQDGVDNGAAKDPYKNFVYTSFQELATHISHKRVGEFAAKKGNVNLAKLCRVIAGDEMRHHLAYREFVKQILERDPSEMILAYAHMMKNKIVMPAMFLRQSGEAKGGSFDAFSDAAQRLGVYTAIDYFQILKILNAHWAIDKLNQLTDAAEKARDYLLALPDRLARISERLPQPGPSVRFGWVNANGM